MRLGLRDRLGSTLLQVKIDPDCMEETARVPLYTNSCLASDSYVQASFGLGAQVIYVPRILSRDGVNAHRQARELELCDSAHYRTADGKTIGTVHEEGDCSSRWFGGSDVGCRFTTPPEV